ncbi:uncharacterized protein Gpxl [Drosophila tropicalis]|uniref:uncharacterized protein Gpxl n=1 Tax=Drosophila tropicalis TaxID=46794 RepID=UPI0035AB997A
MNRASQSVYALAVLDTFGRTVKLKRYMGHVLLIVNIASLCGLTDKQYAGLAQLRETYEADGLRILNFPCNQFGQQMPESDGKAMMEHLIKRNLQIGDIFAKIHVNGPQANPLYRRLTRDKPIEWNFAKFLIDHNGLVYKRYEPTTEPSELAKDIEWLLLQSI